MFFEKKKLAFISETEPRRAKRTKILLLKHGLNSKKKKKILKKLIFAFISEMEPRRAKWTKISL